MVWGRPPLNFIFQGIPINDPPAGFVLRKTVYCTMDISTIVEEVYIEQNVIIRIEFSINLTITAFSLFDPPLTDHVIYNTFDNPFNRGKMRCHLTIP